MTWPWVFPLHQSLLVQILSLSPANSVLEGSFVFSTKRIDENTSARLAAGEAPEPSRAPGTLPAVSGLRLLLGLRH